MMMLHDSSFRRRMLDPSSLRDQQTLMRSPSAFRPDLPVAPQFQGVQVPSTPRRILFHSNLSRDLDICDPCFQRMSQGLKANMPPMEEITDWSQRCRQNEMIGSVNCDVCGTNIRRSQRSKVDIALALRDSMSNLQDIVLACQAFPWTGSKAQLVAELQSGGYTNTNAERLAQLLMESETHWVLSDCDLKSFSIAHTDGSVNVHAITEAVAIHLLKAEEALRKLPETQARYAASRCAISPSQPVVISNTTGESTASTKEYWVLEDDLQREIMRMHGVRGVITDVALSLYRDALSKFYFSPAVQQSAFFIRLNIYSPGVPVGTLVPANNISLCSLQKRPHTLQDYLTLAAKNRKKLAIFAGSITWPPFRASDAAYAKFIAAHREDLYVLIVYLWEAHFVERNPQTGEIVDGWPIGYFDYEYAQHKSLEDRIAMAELASEKLSCMQLADDIVVDDWNNSFNNYFGAWPDQAFLIDPFDNNRLLFRGEFSQVMSGVRESLFSEQMERFLAKSTE